MGKQAKHKRSKCKRDILDTRMEDGQSMQPMS